MARPVQLGEDYRGEEGRVGYLLRQTVHAFHAAMEGGLRQYDLTSAQYGALYVLLLEPGLSAADVARAMGTTAQAASLLVSGMERDGLVRREPHPTHGRVLELYATEEGTRRFYAAQPFITLLEERMCEGLTTAQLPIVKRWLVDSARRLTASPRRHESVRPPVDS